MRHKITVYEQVEKRGLFGRKKTVTVARKGYVDGKLCVKGQLIFTLVDNDKL